MLGDIEMNNAPAIMSQNKKYIEDPEIDGGHYKEINRNELFDVIFQEGPPGLGRRLPMPHHIFCDRRLRHFDSELEQLGMKPRCSPQNI
jgi:hypothetical protein